MTVLQAHWYAAPHVGGIETHLEAIGPELTQLGVPNLLLSGTRESGEQTGVRYEPALDRHATGHDATRGMCERLAALTPPPDVVHLHNLHVQDPERGAMVIAAMRTVWPGTPIMITVHNIGPAAAAAPVLGACDAVYVPSPFIGSVLMRSHGIATHELPYSFPIAGPPTSVADRSAGRVLAQPTRFTWWKGSFHSLAAVVGLLDGGARFTFVHAGATWKSAQAKWDPQADALLPGLRESVDRWVGAGAIEFARLTSAATMQLMTDADVVVYPTVGTTDEGEPFGVAAWQAAATGHPLILTRSGHLDVLASRYDASRVVETASVESLAAAIRDGAEGRLPTARSGLATEIHESVRTCAAVHVEEYTRLNPSVGRR